MIAEIKMNKSLKGTGRVFIVSLLKELNFVRVCIKKLVFCAFWNRLSLDT